MKKIILGATFLTLAFSFSTAQKTAPIKKVQVTAATIASQPAGKPYVIDLTRNGTVYDMAAGFDYSRVRVRTPRGEMPLSALVKKPGLTAGSKFLLGTASDLRAQNFGFPGGGTLQDPGGGGGTSPKITCDPATQPNSLCTCHGFSECLLMVLDKVCAGPMTCFPDGNCNCIQRTAP